MARTPATAAALDEEQRVENREQLFFFSPLFFVALFFVLTA
jgi:hypothetical protein